jgi:hypothetical protein
MVISAHQPAYLPWLGYLDKIKRSDVFVFLDTVQYEKNSYTNRNKIKTSNGPVWLSIPVIKTEHFNMTMNDMMIDNRYNWQRKHLNAIYLAYKKAPYFDKVFPELEKLYSVKYDKLVDATWDHLMFWLNLVGIDTKIIKSSELKIESKKSDLVFDICKCLNADYYISGALGKDYLETQKFIDAGINVEFQDYKHPQYNQLYGDFLPCMGIVDFVMNTDDYSLI